MLIDDRQRVVKLRPKEQHEVRAVNCGIKAVVCTCRRHSYQEMPTPLGRLAKRLINLKPGHSEGGSANNEFASPEATSGELVLELQPFFFHYLLPEDDCPLT